MFLGVLTLVLAGPSLCLLKIWIRSVNNMGHMFLNNSASWVLDSRKIKIRTQNNIKINSEGCTLSLLMTYYIIII